MVVQRVNRMVLGVAVPVARFIGRLTADPIVAVGRYAADRQAWHTVAASGRRVMILEVGLLRELGEDDAVLKARTAFEADDAGVVGLIDGRVIE